MGCYFMQKKLYSVLALSLCTLMIFSLTGCSVLQKLGLGGAEDDELRPVSSVVMDEEEAMKLMNKKPIRLYFANEDNTKLRAEIRYIDAETAGNDVKKLANIIVEELIKGPGKETGLKGTIPEGTRLLSDVVIENNTAIVNLSKEFVDNHPGGKDAEKLTIYSIVNSLTELEGIEKVRFQIEGKTVERLKGGFKFDSDFPRTTSIISKEPPVRGKIEFEGIERKEQQEREGEGTEDKADETFNNMEEEEILE